MRIDLHCHSKFSHDSYFEPEALIEEAINKKLDGVCFTEHYSMNASFPVEKIKVPDGFFVFRGLEISTNQGHLLVYGVRSDEWNIWARNNYLDCIEVMDRVHALGGICVPAHPFRGYDSLGDDVMHIDGFDAIETHNGFNIEKANRQAIQVARHKNLPSIGGSDCHNRMQVGRAFTVFENSVYTMGGLVREIKRGKCKGALRKEA
jgi:predicted metal-dependent phosphoesterase TrpH